MRSFASIAKVCTLHPWEDVDNSAFLKWKNSSAWSVDWLSCIEFLVWEESLPHHYPTSLLLQPKSCLFVVALTFHKATAHPGCSQGLPCLYTCLLLHVQSLSQAIEHLHVILLSRQKKPAKCRNLLCTVRNSFFSGRLCIYCWKNSLLLLEFISSSS